MKFAFAVLLPAVVLSQTAAPTTPQLPSSDQGRALFRSNCAFCHGLTAAGGRGPNLVSATLTHGESDDAIKSVIRTGVPGTTMPAFSEFTDEEMGSILVYLRELAHKTTRQITVPGDIKAGEAVYAKNGCAGCHRIGSTGSVFGPDLTRIGASRPVEYLRESIVSPSADVPESFQAVTVVTQYGQRISGIRINEDTFSVQLRDVTQKVRAFQKDEVRSVEDLKESAMPEYRHLKTEDLQNLVAYLASLRGGGSSSAIVEKARGIR